MTLSRADLAALDGADPLAGVREQFVLPPGGVYLDGNSLGPLPTATAAAVARVVEPEWGEGLIRSWNAAGWIDAPAKVGDKIARLIGARPGEVIVSDSTSVNPFKVLASAVDLAQGRRVIVSEAENFPTDLSMMEGLIALRGSRHALRVVPAEGIGAAVDAETAALAPSIYDEAIRLIARRGFAMSLDRDFGLPYVADSCVEAAWTAVYRDPERHWDLCELGEELVDLEDFFRQWRFRHVTTVERIIGFKPGTGGTAGVAYLRKLLDVRLFPELWDLRTQL